MRDDPGVDWSGVRRMVVLSGAGMSAESGVPTFRGPGGLWEGVRPEELATPEAFARDPGRVWRWYRWRLERVTGARPHRGHEVLVDLEDRLGEGFTLVTQNVDRMHQRAGSRRVVELHGNLVEARCEHCCRRTPAQEVDPDRPGCVCGKGSMRPDVVWFGEGLDPHRLDQAAEALGAADMAVVVGTSSVVYPAAALPGLARERGVRVVEINPDPTPLTEAATVSWRATAAEGLVRLKDRLEAAT